MTLFHSRLAVKQWNDAKCVPIYTIRFEDFTWSYGSAHKY